MSSGMIEVSAFMTSAVKTAPESETLHSVCRTMRDGNIGSVVITGAEGSATPVGIITERDVVRSIASDPSAVNSSIRDIMSKPLVTINPKTTVLDALEIMQSKNIRRLPVVDGNRLVGIVTDKDIMKRMLKDRPLGEVIFDQRLLEQMAVADQPSVFMLGEILHRKSA